MSSLNRDIVEHRLPIKPGFRPFKQKAQHFGPDIYPRIKDEIHGFWKPILLDLAGTLIGCPMWYRWKRKIPTNFGCALIFCNLNKATPKDEYPMPIADMLINSASSNKVISFLDGNAGYNQIFMTEEDTSKTAFICPGFIGLFEWVVMTFGLKNAGATYQRAMNFIFHELLGIILEVYIDDIVVKSVAFDAHLADLRKAFEKM